MQPERAKRMLGRSGYDGNLDYLMRVVVEDPSQLIVWREDNKVVVMQFGMKAILRNIESVILETKKIERHWKDFLVVRKILLSFMKCG